VRLNLGEGLEKKDNDFATGVEKDFAQCRTDPVEAVLAEAFKKEEKLQEEKPKEEPKDEPTAEGPKILAAQVRELRQWSGAGILDSTKALNESGGDIDKDMEWFKKKGMAKVDKKAGNLPVQGAIAPDVHFDPEFGVIVEANSAADCASRRTCELIRACSHSEGAARVWRGGAWGSGLG